MNLRQQVPLRQYTTFHLGGPADYFVEVETTADLVEAIALAKQRQWPIFILGGGSNLLVADEGFRGLVIKLNNRRLLFKGKAVQVDAGCRLAYLVTATAKRGLGGLTWAAGIPGCVGGAARGNAGAYGSDLAESTLAVTAYDLKNDCWLELSKADCRFAYRHSLFKERRDLIIWSIRLELERAEAATLLASAAMIIEQRTAKLPKEFSAGCVFKNLSAADLKDRAAEFGDDCRHGKLAAGLLIEKLALKNQCQGDAVISEQHANFIVNRGQATAAEVKQLMEKVQITAQQKYNLNLIPEIELLGF